jgi:hypothetical protein
MRRRSFIASLPLAATAAALPLSRTNRASADTGDATAPNLQRVYCAASEMRADGCALAY